MQNIPLNERIIFALDFASPDEAKSWVDRLHGHIGYFKVGFQLFLAGGWPMIDYITARGGKVMLDLKFYDIPETVSRAVQQVNGRGVSLVTVHGIDAVVKAATASKDNKLEILAVTVLTSFAEADLLEMGINRPLSELVLKRAQRAVQAGCGGVVASAHEAERLRQELGPDFLIVTPGIRPGSCQGANFNDDQRRVATAMEAMKNGVSHVVIGRPIRAANEPAAAVEMMLREIEEGLKARNSGM